MWLPEYRGMVKQSFLQWFTSSGIIVGGWDVSCLDHFFGNAKVLQCVTFLGIGKTNYFIIAVIL